MKLTRLTITGADDGVDPQRLLELSHEFPFVEWGILCSASREGTPRYPTAKWRQLLRSLMFAGPLAIAAHLCGQISRSAIAGHEVLGVIGGSPYRRVQLNGFDPYRLPMLRAAQLHQGQEFILQCQTVAGLQHVAELAKMHPNVSALWDQSGGSGVFYKAEIWPTVPDALRGRWGIAGGISPDTLLEAIDDVQSDEGYDEGYDSACWIDFESGARTNGKFDLDKVQRALEIARPHIVTP